MRFYNRMTAKVLVWLAAILVPAESLPLMACGCGSQSPRRAAVKPARADATPAAKCPHCTGGSQPRHSCCGATAASSPQRGSCCGANGSCCCKGGLGSQGGLCQCSANKSAPAPDPLPNDSRTDNTKSSLGSSSDTVAAVAVVVQSAVLAQAAQQPSLLGSTSLERLSTLCRLVI
jgi:hypothetical protein